MKPSKDLEIAEMAVCVAICSVPEPKNALISPIFTKIANCVAPDIALNATPYDVIVLDDMPSSVKDTKSTMNAKGVLVCKVGNGDIEDAKKALQALSEEFRIVMPFFDLQLVFASDYYHPTADIILHKADLLDGLEVYNSDFHKASFTLANWQLQELKGISKN